MFHLKLRETLNQSISNVTADLTSYVIKPGKDFSRVRKLSPETPSVSALNQRYQYVAADDSTISFLVFLVLLPRTISFPKVIPQGDFTACTLMLFLIWTQKPIRMPLFSPHIKKMNFWLSVSLLTDTKFLTT